MSFQYHGNVAQMALCDAGNPRKRGIRRSPRSLWVHLEQQMLKGHRCSSSLSCSEELFCSSNRETAMKKISTIGVVMGAAMLCAIPISLNWSPEKGSSILLDSAE